MRCWFGSKLAAAGCVLAACMAAAAAAQEAKSVFMVLWRGETAVEAGFHAYLAENELPVETRTVSVGRDPSNLAGVIEEIRAADPDLVYSWGTPVTLALAGRDSKAQEAAAFPPQIEDRPLVFTMVSRPVASGIVGEDRLSGRNVTGVSHVVPMETQVQAMLAYMPVDRIAVIYTEAELNSRLAVDELKAVAEGYGIRVDTYPVPLGDDGRPDPAALPGLVEEAARAGPQFLYLGPDSFLGEYAQEIVGAANDAGLATFASTERMLASSDALYGLVAPYEDVGRLTARKVEEVLFGGTDPGGIPVETLPSFSYRIRLDVARRIGVLPSMSLMDYAELNEGAD